MPSHNLKRTDLIWHSGGYWMLKPPTGYKPRTLLQGRYVAYHRMMAETKLLRRPLKPKEKVIFRDGNSSNLALRNFIVTDAKGLAEHREKLKKRAPILSK